MYRTILVPCDGSNPSEYAIPFAIEIARRDKGSVTLLRALPDSLLVTDLPTAVQASSRRLAEIEMARLKKAFESSEVPVSVRMRIGFPVEEILLAAATSDLIVMTTHGRGGINRWVMGSVADKAIRLSSVPVLAIHPPEKRTRAMAEAAALRMFRDVCVPLDGSPLAERSLAELGQFAGGEARINLMRTVAKDAGGAAEDLADNYLQDVASKLEARGVRVTRSVQKGDNAAEEIAKYAIRTGCGLIVMTTHGASGITRWMLGGVTDKVVRRGPTPVLAIRASRKLWKGGKRPLAAAPRKKKKSTIVI